MVSICRFNHFQTRNVILILIERLGVKPVLNAFMLL